MLIENIKAHLNFFFLHFFLQFFFINMLLTSINFLLKVSFLDKVTKPVKER